MTLCLTLKLVMLIMRVAITKPEAISSKFPRQLDLFLFQEREPLTSSRKQVSPGLSYFVAAKSGTFTRSMTIC